MSDSIKIRRALISVYDKTGIVEFARALHEEFGIEIISTGGTAKTLIDAGIPVTLVEEITGFPEMLDGRVKTLHPKIHAAILADRDNPEHMRQLKEQGIESIDMVVVNLYPFEKTIARPDCTFEEAIEMIDIGGPCLLRAAAKSHKHVLIVSDPILYKLALVVVKERGIKPDQFRRKILAFNAFARTTAYDGGIASWLSRPGLFEPPTFQSLQFCQGEETSYGENPHQRGAAFNAWGMRGEHQLIGAAYEDSAVHVSFNNYADASAALELCAELTRAGLCVGDQHLGDRPPAGLTDQRSVPQNQRSVPRDQREANSSGRAASSGSINEEHFSRRHLPHIERPQATYFITFRLRGGELSPAERDQVLSACMFWHGKRMTLHCACVMPDHVHMILTPFEQDTGRWVPLGKLLKSIKNFSAREINKTRGARGSLWLDENFDRIIRDEADFQEKWDCIFHNPVTAGLTSQPEDYRWFWQSGLGYQELEVNDRPEVGPPKVCCFIKHTNACGAAVEAPKDPSAQACKAAALEAYRKAYLGDPNAAMGGILAVNFNVDAPFAEAVMETYQRWGKPLKEAGHPAAPGAFFIEVWLAPSFDEEAVRIIRGEKEGAPQKAWGQRVRLLDVGDMSIEPDPSEMDFKRIAGGVLMQTRDLVGLNEDEWKVVTERKPTDAEMDDLRLAWLICKHTKSNAITICRDGLLIGNGAGQMSRVMSCRIATWLAKENGHEERLKGAAAASDAFFPFRDGPDILAEAGVTAIIQPGGSKRDEEVIAACNERGVAMIFTGTRHFKH